MRESDEYQVSQLDRALLPRRRRYMGDLTESKKEERGEFLQQPGTAPADLPTQIITGAPKIASGVMPSYDVLPANAGRFNFGQLASVALSTNTVSTQVVFTQIIPQGRVVIVNKFRCNVEGSNGLNGSGIPPTPYTVTLFLNGQAEIYNQVIFVQPLDDWYDCQMIAGPGDIITVQMQGDFSTLTSIPTSLQFITHLTGDMLLPNELPTQYTALRQTAFPVFNEGDM